MSAWDSPSTVAGFIESPPNAVLLRYAVQLRGDTSDGRVLDIGCGAARNALPLARAGWQVLGTDTSRPMLEAAAGRARTEALGGRLCLAQASMDSLPVADRRIDLIVAHGIWNLARSSAELGAGVREAARVAKPGAGLFVFTFSRHTLPPTALPVPGEAFVFTDFSGAPQCFLTEAQLIEELAAAGFTPDPAVPLTELGRATTLLRTAAGPVIYEGAFRFAAS